MNTCPYCIDGVITDRDGYIKPCSHCMSPDKFMASIDRAIKESKSKRDSKQLKKLVAVREFLPDYPVMAVLEAEARNCRSETVDMIREAFGVRIFADASYATVNKGKTDD